MAKMNYPAVGERFGRLTVTGGFSFEIYTNQQTGSVSRIAMCGCRCDCGWSKSYRLNRIRAGLTRSCGCLRREVTGAAGPLRAERLHGNDPQRRADRQRLWRIWHNMIGRCTDATTKDYGRYGARGVTVCSEWLESFSVFHHWALANGYEPTLTLDRRDNATGYAPGNCRWATAEAQARNRRNNRLATAFGETKCLAAWVSDPRCAVGKQTLRQRIESGAHPELAITLPARQWSRSAQAAS